MNELKDRLKQARRNAGLTQSELAERAGIKQSSVSEIERGLSRSSAHLIKLAQVCGVDPVWLAEGNTAEQDARVARAVAASDRYFRGPSEDDYALIPQFTAKGSCGDGYMNDHVEVKEGLVFKKDWLRRVNAKPENLFVIYADGDSMEPYIFQGDVVLFDISQTEPKHRQVFVIKRPDGGNSIKRLMQNLSGAWVIQSDNPDKITNPDEIATVETIHEIPILGRVIWRGGGVG